MDRLLDFLSRRANAHAQANENRNGNTDDNANANASGQPTARTAETTTTTTTVPPFLREVRNVQDPKALPLNTWMVDRSEGNVFYIMPEWDVRFEEEDEQRSWELLCIVKQFSRAKIEELYCSDLASSSLGDEELYNNRGHAEVFIGHCIRLSGDGWVDIWTGVGLFGVLVRIVCKSGPAPGGGREQGYTRIPMRPCGRGFVSIKITMQGLIR